MKEEILLGSLMGDTSIYKSKSGYYNLSIEHSLIQEEYCKWKKDQLGITNKIYYRNRFDKRTNKTYSSCSIYRCSNEYKKYYEMFYNPKKQITIGILSKLTDLSLAIWYCDDGWYYRNLKYSTNQIGLATNGFSEESVKLIINWFKDKYNLNFKMVKNKSIRITSKLQCDKFLSLIKSYIPSCMNYKL